jgi:glycine cleavage system H protein
MQIDRHLPTFFDPQYGARGIPDVGTAHVHDGVRRHSAGGPAPLPQPCGAGPAITPASAAAYAIRLMQDVYFRLVRERGDARLKQQVGNIETSKAVSDLFAPIADNVDNQPGLEGPVAHHVDGYGRGWIFEMTGNADDTMDADAYHAYLTANWDQTQRILKGQMGE